MARRFSLGPVGTVTLAVALSSLLAPVTVMAATGSGVNLVDKINAGSVARVTAKGTLWVSETDPVTGAQSQVVNGRRLVVSDMASPATPWVMGGFAVIQSGATSTTLFSGTGPKRLNISSLTLAAEGSTAGSVKVTFQVYVHNTGTGDCSTLTGFGAAERFLAMIPVGETLHLAYPTPLVYSSYTASGHTFCVAASGSGPSGWKLWISGTGFISG
jgi:hypothetical protein